MDCLIVAYFIPFNCASYCSSHHDHQMLCRGRSFRGGFAVFFLLWKVRRRRQQLSPTADGHLPSAGA